MAIPPNTPTASEREEAIARRKAAEEEALLREVDDAVRESDLQNFAENYGKQTIAGVVLILAAFGGFLFWQSQQDAAREVDSEALIGALDQVEAGNLQTGFEQLETLAGEDKDGASAAAQMLRGAIASQDGRNEEAAAIFAELAADENAPSELRDLALIREVSEGFDTMDPADVIAKLKPLAAPGNAFFGSAGELVAMAYLEQDNTQEAGALFAQIAKDENTPDSLKSRARQMASLLGVDAVEDVDALLEEQGVTTEEAQAATNAAVR